MWQIIHQIHNVSMHYLFSIEYWFRVLDIDGDGVLSLFELVYFYEEVLLRLQELNIDCLSVENTVCQILDMINPRDQGRHIMFSHKQLLATVTIALWLKIFVNCIVGYILFLNH